MRHLPAIGVLGLTIAGIAYTVRRRSIAKTKALRRPLVVCGPSGVGKGTLLAMLTKEFPGKFSKCVSHTTRAPRAGEVNGQHYNFVTKETMEAEIAQSKFIEYANVHGNYYGTSIAGVQKVADEGCICILEIDVQGAEQVRATELEPYYLFIAPPSKQDLRKRLLGRGSENEDTLNTRLKTAEMELDFMEKCSFVDCTVVNDDLQRSYEELRGRILAFYPQLKA